MPRKAHMKGVQLDITPEQAAALDAACTGEEKAGFIRDAIAKAVRKRGYPWPDNYPERGKYLRNK